MWQINISVKDIGEVPPKAAELLVLFLSISDGYITHTIDRERFYGFIRHCHARQVKLTSEQFSSLLIRVGCTSSQAKYLANIYEHGRNLLKVPCPA